MLKAVKIEKDFINIRNIIDNAKCYEIIRELRWPNGVTICPKCHSDRVVKNGHHKSQEERQKYHCNDCSYWFDDLTGTIFTNHHQPLSVWVLCLYFMGLNLSNLQIAQELELNESNVQQMTTLLREGVSEKKPEVTLRGEVECDEVYVVAGHKGQPEACKKNTVRVGVTD